MYPCRKEERKIILQRRILVGKIVNFCFTYGGLDDERIGISELTQIIEDRLEEAYFLETLINTIIIKTKKHKGVDITEVKTILIELEKIRLEQEYKDYIA